MDLSAFALSLAELAPQVTALAAEHPDWMVRRSPVTGNACFLDGGEFVGWVDSLDGTLTLVGPDAGDPE